MTNIASIAAKVRALLAKTTDAGATEHEMASALAKARELMDTYQLDLGEVGLRTEGATVAGTVFSTYADYLAASVAEFCNCRVWSTRDGQTRTVKFLGLRSDAELASWLLDHLNSFIKAECAGWLLDAFGSVTLQDAESFASGAIARIKSRLRAATGRSDNALVRVRDKIVDEAYRVHGPRNLRYTRHQARLDQSRAVAYTSGDAAGSRASFAKPIGGHVGALPAPSRA